MTASRGTPRTSTLALACSLLAAPALAQTKDDGGLWLLWLGQGNLGAIDKGMERVRWWLDVQGRWRDEGETFETGILRPGLGYAIADRVTLFAGYAWILNEPAGRDEFVEHRAWQQLTWNLPVSGCTLQSRTRLEERFPETDGDTGWRLREFLKSTVPLDHDGGLFASLWDEVFFDLNDTDWGQRSGLRQNRAFAGLGWFVDAAHKWSFEVGYLNQWIDRTTEDRMNHILSINLFMNF